MCTLDYEGTCPVWREVPRVARTKHECDACGSAIRPGEPYLDHSHVYDGSAASEDMCFACWWARTEFAEAHPLIPVPSMFMEDVRGCISDEEEPRWRLILASLLRRFRTSPRGRLTLHKKWVWRAQRRALLARSTPRV